MNLTTIQQKLMDTVCPPGLIPPLIRTIPGHYGVIQCTYELNNETFIENFSRMFFI
jgi:hypothetical protein